jgi:WD40 repeat protein
MKYIRTDRTILALAFSPDGKYLASGGWKHVGLWDRDSGKFTEIRQRECLKVPCIAFSKDGTCLIWVCQMQEGNENEIRVARLRKGKQTARQKLPQGSVAELAALPDQKVLIAGGAECLCWELPSLRQLAWPAVLPEAGTVSIWESALGRIPTLCRGKGQPRSAFDLLAGGAPIARTEQDRLSVWEVGGIEPIFSQDHPAVQAVAFAPDGRTLIGCEDRRICQWETNGWQRREQFDWEIGCPQCLAVSPDGLTAAASGYAGDIIVWDIDS